MIKTTKNKIFGGFTPLNWSQKNDYEIDMNNQTFIFSLNLKKKYNMIQKDGYAIHCSKALDQNLKIEIFDWMKIWKKEKHIQMNLPIFLSGNNLELTGGKGECEEFEINEFEIFKVIY